MHTPNTIVEKNTHYCDELFAIKLKATLNPKYDEKKLKYIFDMPELNGQYIDEEVAHSINGRIRDRLIEVVNGKEVKSNMCMMNRHHSLVKQSNNFIENSSPQINRLAVKGSIPMIKLKL